MSRTEQTTLGRGDAADAASSSGNNSNRICRRPKGKASITTAWGRRSRNKLYKTKGAQIVKRYLLQEGVPASTRVQGQVAEAVVYQIANQFVGGFYRMHGEKSDRENLNSPGMGFSRMCPHVHRYGEAIAHPDPNIFDVYRILARIAGIAAHREIRQLEMAQS